MNIWENLEIKYNNQNNMYKLGKYIVENAKDGVLTIELSQLDKIESTIMLIETINKFAMLSSNKTIWEIIQIESTDIANAFLNNNAAHYLDLFARLLNNNFNSIVIRVDHHDNINENVLNDMIKCSIPDSDQCSLLYNSISFERLTTYDIDDEYISVVDLIEKAGITEYEVSYYDEMSDYGIYFSKLLFQDLISQCKFITNYEQSYSSYLDLQKRYDTYLNYIDLLTNQNNDLYLTSSQNTTFIPIRLEDIHIDFLEDIKDEVIKLEYRVEQFKENVLLDLTNKIIEYYPSTGIKPSAMNDSTTVNYGKAIKFINNFITSKVNSLNEACNDVSVKKSRYLSNQKSYCLFEIYYKETEICRINVGICSAISIIHNIHICDKNNLYVDYDFLRSKYLTNCNSDIDVEHDIDSIELAITYNMIKTCKQLIDRLSNEQIDE